MLGQGVMARRIADVRAGLRVVSGAHARDPISVPVVLDEFPAAKKTRVAVMANPPGGTTHLVLKPQFAKQRMRCRMLGTK